MTVWAGNNGAGLFSAYAEVFPSLDTELITRSTFLCLRRGVSKALHTAAPSADFSLPTQRCFQRVWLQVTEIFLFSAYAEVFPLAEQRVAVLLAFLCLRRGVSTMDLPIGRYTALFSAYAEVFPWWRKTSVRTSPFLCLRRGVSHCFDAVAYAAGFSLPTQRCFYFPA